MRFLASVVASLVLLALPTLTVWLGSSLIAFHGGPRELALVGGLLLFPVLPALWEWRATVAFRRAASRKQFGQPPKRALTPFGRLALRTLAVCLVFSGAMVLRFPSVTFAALATRGDWFLAPGAEGEPLRDVVFWLAQRLEGLHRLANENPYATAEDQAALAAIDPVPVVVPQGSGARWRPLTDDDRRRLARDRSSLQPQHGKLTDADVPETPARTPPSPEPEPTDADDARWPWPSAVAPVVAGMTAHDETSIAAVAQYIRSRERDPFRRVKALHDWVVTRLRYDDASLVPGHRKAQDANSVFGSRLAVCEGYARLLVELGKQSGDRIIYVTGDVREANGAAAPVGHAWNAVELGGRWYLLDATWDDPSMTDGSDAYRTDYLFVPPQVAVWSHFPDDRRWQLLERPLSRGDFLRQPFARPGIAREGLTLHSPARAAVDASSELRVSLDNPLRRWLLVEYHVEGRDRVQCGVTNDQRVELSCPVEASGSAVIFSNDQQYGDFAEVVRVAVTRR